MRDDGEGARFILRQAMGLRVYVYTRSRPHLYTAGLLLAYTASWLKIEQEGTTICFPVEAVERIAWDEPADAG